MSKSDFDDELVLVEARSFIDRAEEINRKIRSRMIANMVALPLASAIAFALIASSFYFFAMPESKRLALANRENITWNR